MRYLQIHLLIMLAGTTAAAEAAEIPPTVEQSVPGNALTAPQKNIVTVVIENDSFGGGTDRNYTSGVRINLTNVNAKFPDIAHAIDRWIPTFRINKTSSIHYSIGHSIYTPRDITRTTVNPNDRPWAAFLYGSLGMTTLTDNHTDQVEGTLGVIGPAAMGEWSQKLIHKHLTDSQKPRGWSHQLKHEPGVALAWQRAWPMMANGQIANRFWSFKPYLGSTIGNISTYADIGFTFRISPFDAKLQDTPIRVHPSMPGTGIYEVRPNKWSWDLFSGIEGRAVAHNIFLDGNTFANSYSVDKKPFVADANVGFTMTYNNTRISYTAVYRTKEFVTQDHPEIFGAISLGGRF